jgi:hypothetical protein
VSALGMCPWCGRALRACQCAPKNKPLWLVTQGGPMHRFLKEAFEAMDRAEPSEEK